MAKKQKVMIKPLFGLKHDFYDSLDSHLQQSIMLIQGVEQVLKAGAVSEPGASILRELLDEFRAGLSL
jgi:hypothetical protein